MMTARTAKLLLVAGVGILYTLVVLNNITDYDSNYQFARHVLMMDSTFSGNHLMWRAINSPRIHTAFYLSVIAWESMTMLSCWLGAIKMLRALHGSKAEFHRAKRWAVAALTLGMLMWLIAFLCVGSEWFLMWQSKNWNGQEAAFRMFCVMGVIQLLIVQPDEET